MTNKQEITFFLALYLIIYFLISGCNNKNGTTEPEVTVGEGFMTVLPLKAEDFYLFVNLGHLGPPGHTFPSDHGGYYLTDWEQTVPVFSPADMQVTRITRVEHAVGGYFDYDMTLSVNNGDFEIVMGHLSGIHVGILAQAPAFDTDDCTTYTTGGETYTRCLVWTDIPVSAGDTLGSAGGNPGQFGLDFGTFDQNVHHSFASSRFEDYKYPHTVSPLDYFTEEIQTILLPICGDYICGVPLTRTQEPVGGTVQYDLPGTARGLWFKRGEPTSPEDPHLALVYCNVEADVPVFSVGTSIPDLNTGLYTFTPAATGTANRLFGEVEPGSMYRYEIRNRCSNSPVFNAVILLQLTNDTTLKLEKQLPGDGPPWSFTDNAVIFVR
ncbi:MAG: hypothetical protein R6V04_03390 [bacterium]